jgi:XRE family aerobic/anaerobic benzoate catabolism transcriptional regulator
MHYSACVSRTSSPLLDLVAGRVRTERVRKGWTQDDLSRRSGVSLRYVADVERGEANISLLRLAEIASALGVSIASLVAGSGPVRDPADELASLTGDAQRRALDEARSTGKIALVGLRGAGKSAVGRRLAARLAVPFVEVDAVVEEAAGLRLGEIFEFHGAARYRELERQALERVLAEPGGAVLATGGSVVTASESWTLLRNSTRTVWLRASPEVHLSRVEGQGDFRPMRGRADALAELRGILADREPLYAQAEREFDTEAGDVEAIAGRIAGWVVGSQDTFDR